MKISVIVPVYNAEKFLNKCIDSVVKQSYTDWELLLIDDGSSDGSAKIIESACEMDARIKAFYQQNAGPGIARNKGISVATGYYIVFLDADDYIDSEYFALLAQNEEKDVVFIDVHQVTPTGHVLKKEAMSVYKTWSKEKITRAQMTGKIPWGGVRKAVKRELLIQNHIEYAAYNVGEEALYSFRIINEAKSIGFIEKAVYFYVNHENSQSKIIIDDPWGAAVESIRDYLMKNELYEQYADTLNAFNLTATVVSLDRIQQMYCGTIKENRAFERLKQFKCIYDTNAKIDNSNLMNKAKIFEWFILHDMYRVVFIFSNLKKLLR